MPKRAGSGTVELDRDALDGDADARAVAPARRPSRSAAGARTRSSDRAGLRRPGRRRRGRTRRRPSAAGRLRPRRRAPLAICSTSGRARLSISPRAAALPGPASSRARICLSVAGPMPGTDLQHAFARRGRNSSAVSTPSVPPRSRASASVAMPSSRPSPTSSGRTSRSQLVQLRDRPGVGELAEPRGDAGPDPAQLLRAPCAHELRESAPASRGSSRPPAGRRARCTLDAPARSSSAGEGLEPLGDRRVVERGRHVATTVPARWRRSSTASSRPRSTSSSPSGTRWRSRFAPTAIARPPSGSRRCASLRPPCGRSTSSRAGSRRTTAHSSKAGDKLRAAQEKVLGGESPDEAPGGGRRRARSSSTG